MTSAGQQYRLPGAISITSTFWWTMVYWWSLTVVKHLPHQGMTLPLQARKQLAGFPKDKKKYEALLTDLLVQALVKLKQPAVIVKGREVSLRLLPKVDTPPDDHASQHANGACSRCLKAIVQPCCPTAFSSCNHCRSTKTL